MALTGRIGSADSRLGNIVLGYGASRRRNFVRSPRSPRYRVQAFEFADTTTFGIGSLVAEFDRFKGLAYADYLNDVPEMFCTLMQDDPKVRALRGKDGRLHFRVWRNDDLVWAGWGYMETSANARDVVIYGYGYLAGLYWMHSDWNQEWTSATVQTIVTDAWTRAKTTLTNSRLGFVGTGSIESPPTTFGGSTAITLPLYSAFYKRLLFLMKEMAAISISDTGNTVVFEITHDEAPVFNFWKNRTATLDRAWRYGETRSRGIVADFHDVQLPVYHRNDVLAVGSTPRDTVLRKEQANATDQTTTGWGRMEEALFLAWVRDETELDRVSKLRAAKALRTEMALQVSFYPGAVVPPNAIGADFRNGDRVPVVIDRGITSINDTFQIVGYQVGVIGGQERVNALIQEPV